MCLYITTRVDIKDLSSVKQRISEVECQAKYNRSSSVSRNYSELEPSVLLSLFCLSIAYGGVSHYVSRGK